MRDLAYALVAHRGFPDRYPENTLRGLTAALEAGAQWLEFDVQLCTDGVPVLLHDPDLARTGDLPLAIADLPAARLSEVRVGYSRRFGELYRDEPLPTLTAAAELLRRWPHATAFVEIKKHSVHRFGIERCVEAIQAAITPVQAPARNQMVMISFHAGVLRLGRKLYQWPIGWIFESWSPRSRRIAERLNPDYLFSSLAKVPAPGTLWPGSWRWALYHTADPSVIRHWLGHGVTLVETNAIGDLLAMETP